MDIKKAGVKPNTRVERSIMELSQTGFSRTGTSKYNKSYKIKGRWTKETAIAASLIWPNSIKVGNDAKRKGFNGEFVKLTGETQCAKILLKKRVNTIDFEYSMSRNIPILNYAHLYYNIHWNKYVRKMLDVTTERREKEVSDNARVLATLILSKELGNIGPYIIYGNINGRIKLSNRCIEYTMYRELTLGVNNVVIDILCSVDGDDKVNVIENIDEVVLDRKFNIEKKMGWKLINFKYKGDIMADEKVVNELKMLLFKKIQEGVKYEMSIFEGYDIIFREKLSHHVRRLFWYGNNRSVTFGVIVNFEKKIKDVKYGLFKLLSQDNIAIK